MQDLFHPLGLFVFHVQDDLAFTIIDDALAVLAVIKGEKVIQILCGKDGGAAVATDDLCNFQDKFCGQAVAGCPDELPDFIHKDSLFLRPVFLGDIPHIVQGNKHAHRQQIPGQFGDIQDRILIGQVHVGLLVKRGSRAVDQTVQDMGHAFRVIAFHQDVIDILQNRHRLIPVRMNRIDQGLVFVGDPFLCIGLDQRFIKKLPLLMGHIRDEQAEEDMQLLDLPGQRRVVHGRAVQQLIDRVICFPDLHDVDAVAAGGGDLDELPADILAGTVELMAFQRGDDKYFDILAPHPGGKKLHGERLACARAA